MQDQATKDFLLMDLMSEAQKFTTQIFLLNKYICLECLLLHMQVNLGLCETNKMYCPHKKKSDSLLQI
jgi:hypothetical protein